MEFGSRAFIAADFITGSPYLDQCIYPKPTAFDNDCDGHGTHVAGTLGGVTYGAAKGVTIRSVKVCAPQTYGCPTDVIINGVNWVTADHQGNPSTPALANMSISGPITAGVDNAIINSINSGVTYVVAAGNNCGDASLRSPAHITAALTVGASNSASSRVLAFPFGGCSNFGGVVDLFAPVAFVLSSISTSDTATDLYDGTSMASPHVAGAVALYLQGRAGMANCSAYPIQNPSSALGGAISTCPDRVARLINSNANLNRLTNVNGTDASGNPVYSPNRFLWTASVPSTTNPGDNQRFFVWQQYSDFLPYDPDEGGLDFWTSQITSHCGVGFNGNNACSRTYRASVSKEFFRVAFPTAFNNNSEFVHLCYEAYLRRSVPNNDGGFQLWLGQLNSYGTPASEAGKDSIIDAFITCGEYRQRFGQP